MFKYIVIGVIAIAIIGSFLFWKFGPSFNQPKTPPKASELLVWGLWEDESYIKPALDEYKKLHPDLTVKYVYQNSLNYRSRAQTQIQAGQGPDVLMIHNTWVPLFTKTRLLSAAPPEVITMKDFENQFYPVVKEDFTNYSILKYAIYNEPKIKESARNSVLQEEFSKSGKIYAMPRGIDGLALYYNEDILNSLGISVPKDWFEFKDAAYKATVIDETGEIKTAGAAIGLTGDSDRNVGNIDHWSDLLGLLFLQQPGARIDDPTSDIDANVLRFYTQFANKENKVWDKLEPFSTKAFEEGRLAFYFAPSWRVSELRQVNPLLNFKIAPVPQVPGSGKKVAWASYWGYAVSSQSKYPKDAWEFIKFFTSDQTQQLLYRNAVSTNGRFIGLPYASKSLQNELIKDPLAGAFVEQGPYYQSWYLSSYTKDQALNEEMIKYFEDAVNVTVSGLDAKAALDTAAKGVQSTLLKYLTPGSPTGTK